MKSRKVKNIFLSIVLKAFVAQLLWGLLPFALTGVFVDQHSTNSITQHSDGHKQISSEILGLAEFDEDSLPEEEHEQDAYQPELPIAVFYNRIFKLHFSGLGHHFIASTSGKDRCIAMQCFRC